VTVTTYDTQATDVVLRMVAQERAEQERVWGEQSCAHDVLPPGEKLAVLVEEVGEVARALNELRVAPSFLARKIERANLRTELVQVAASATAWAESLLGEIP
jgi:NTP pyrophosphatase (non-canonical NTP hydrolase)